MGARTGVSILLVAAACSGPAADVDAGPDLPDTGSPAAYAPAPPAPPSLAPCPAGWREVDIDGVPACDPWPASGRAACPDGSTHFPGDPGCDAVGDPCPAGDWPEDIPAGASVIYVRAGATGGDGSPSRPHGSIRTALSIAAPGTLVVLARGRYFEQVLLEGDMLVGACAAETIIEASPASGAIINARGAGNVVRNVTVTGVSWGLVVEGGAELRIDGVISDRATWAGVVVVAGGTLTGRELLVRNTQPSPIDGDFGRGVEITSGTVELSRVVIEDNLVSGISAQGDSSVHLTDIAIRGTRERTSDRLAGTGVVAELGAELVLERAIIEDNREFGALSSGGSSLVLRDAVVRGTRAGNAGGTLGRGVGAQADSSVTLERVLVVDNVEAGVSTAGPGDRIELTDVVIRDTRPRETDGFFGRGISAQGGSVGLTRVDVAGSHEVGLALGPGVIARATDVRVSRTSEERASGAFGRGVSIDDAELTFERLEIVDSREVGLMVTQAGAVTTGTDLLVSNTRGSSTSGLYGRGLQVQSGAQVTVSRALLSYNREISVAVVGADTRLVLREISITDTLERACVETGGCASMPAGHGIAVYRHAYVEVTGFEITRNALAGVQLALDGELDLHRGVISENPVGANVQVPGYDLDRLSDEVTFEHNGVALDSDEIPIPEPEIP